jgi:hypothetical protein
MRGEVRNSIRIQSETDFQEWYAFREITEIPAKKCIGYCEAKRYKTWSDEEYSKSVDQRKHAKLWWLHNPSVLNEDKLSNVRREASRHFRNKTKGLFEIHN